MTPAFYLFIAYMLAPKIDLVQIGQSGGIRPEDFISLAGALMLIFGRRQRKFPMPGFMAMYLFVVGIGFASTIINISQNGILGFIFSLRLLEYVVWFFLIYDSAHRLQYDSVRKSLLAILGVLLIWGILEYFGVIKIGRFSNVTERLSLNTSGPYEASVIVAVLVFAVQSYVVLPFGLLILWLTQARITMVGGLVALIAGLPARKLPVAIVGALTIGLVSVPIAGLLGQSRFVESASPTSMFDLLYTTYERARPQSDPAAYRARYLNSLEGLVSYIDLRDANTSFNIRAVRWMIVTKSTITNSKYLAIGASPGAWGTALDGYYFRQFGETGLIGLAALIAWIVISLRSFRRSSIVFYQLTTMIVAAFFIDVFSSSKIMPMLWAFAALEYSKHPHALPSTARTMLKYKHYQQSVRDYMKRYIPQRNKALHNSVEPVRS